jgi:DNA-binding response OmpR family regulator
VVDEGCVLLVEADILVRQPLAEYLRECGYKVAEAANVMEARQLLRERKIPIDVVLADAGADPEGCFALASWVRSDQPGVELILAGTVPRMASEAGELCEDTTLKKPYDHSLVLGRIKQARAARDRQTSDADKPPSRCDS